MRVPATLVAAAAVVAALAGCAGGADSSSIVRTGPTEAIREPDGKLDAEPGPLTVRDLRREPEGSPRSVVMRLLFLTQWGAVPSVVGLYDPHTVSEVGARSIRSIYRLERLQLLSSRPQTVFKCRREKLAFVAIRLLSPQYTPQPKSFVLHRLDREWRIAYDTFLDTSPAAAQPDAASNALRTSRLRVRESPSCS